MKDGNCVEGVLMHYHHGYTLCISTQVGCRMGCTFCASTLEGCVRSLTAGEMLGEVLCANRYSDTIVCYSLDGDGTIGPEMSRINVPQAVSLAVLNETE